MPEWKCENCGNENEVGIPEKPTRFQCKCGFVAYIQETNIISQGWPEEVDKLWSKAKRLIQLAAKGVDAGDLSLGTGKEINLFCPTCFRKRKGYVSKELFEKLNGAAHSIVNQCSYCRQKDRKVDLEYLAAVLKDEIAPLPKLDETTSLSDLINEEFERMDEE
ncbi:MAG: hypothetical protein ACFFDB_00630 [Promethearchaeota archaeon]